jgi:aquaporin Z
MGRAVQTVAGNDGEQGKPPATEAQKLLAEWLGTFFLVFVATGAIVVDGVSHGQIGRASSVVPPGLVVMAAILSLGELSGAHLNPVVTVAFAMRGDFPWGRVPGYLVAQLAGGLCASLLLWAMFGNVRMLGVTEPGTGISNLQAVTMELMLTLGLVSTILGTASESQNIGGLSAVGVGGYIVLAGLWSSPISGASMNPVRSLAPALVLQDFRSLWIYLLGPFGGALIAVAFAYLLRGRGHYRSESKAAQGS